MTATARHTTLRNLREIIDSEAVSPTFQPVISLRSGDVHAYEALSRFDRRHFPSPATAFDAATREGVGVELELLAIRKAFGHLGNMPDGTWMSANLSVAALATPDVVTTLLQHAGDGIVVELTEHAPVTDYGSLVETTERLRAAGIRLAVDDTGAGFSSLSHILQLRPDIIKLDITLTRGIDTDPVRMALARSLVSFALDIDAMLIAEGIETTAEYEKLRNIGVQFGQGYYLARPGPLPDRAPISAPTLK